MAGKAYLSFSSTTSSDYAAMQLLSWTFQEIAMCPITHAQCSNSGQDLGQTFLPLLVKNIGTEKLYIKFKYQKPAFNPISEWFDCRQPLTGLDYFDDTELKLETSIYNPVQYGCNMTILYDATVNDIIFHDVSNSTWNSITRVYGTFSNSYLLGVSDLTLLKNLSIGPDPMRGESGVKHATGRRYQQREGCDAPLHQDHDVHNAAD